MTSETCTFQLDTQLLKCCWPPMFAYARNPHVFLEVGLSAVHELSVHSSSVACLLAAVFVRRPPHFFSLFFFLSLSLSLSLSLTHAHTHTHSLSPFFYFLDSIYWTGLMWRHYIGVSWSVRQEFCPIVVGIQRSVVLKFGNWESVLEIFIVA